MEKLREPLKMTEAENREALARSERNLQTEGSQYGNRHHRRLAARVARLEEKARAKKDV